MSQKINNLWCYNDSCAHSGSNRKMHTSSILVCNSIHGIVAWCCQLMHLRPRISMIIVWTNLAYCSLLRTRSFWSGRQSENNDPVEEGQCGLAGLNKRQNANVHMCARVRKKLLWKLRSSKRGFVDGALLYQLNQAEILQKILIIIDPVIRWRLPVACHQWCSNCYRVFISCSKNQEDGSWKVKVGSHLIVAGSIFSWLVSLFWIVP